MDLGPGKGKEGEFGGLRSWCGDLAEALLLFHPSAAIFWSQGRSSACSSPSHPWSLSCQPIHTSPCCRDIPVGLPCGGGGEGWETARFPNWQELTNPPLMGSEHVEATDGKLGFKKAVFQ